MNQTKKQAELRTIILDKIYAKGPISRIDISKETGITPATVSAITGSLIQEKLLYELGEDEEHAKVGRKKILLGIKKQHSYFIGCELSEKYFSFVLSDNTGNVIDKDKATVTSEKILAEGADLFCHLLEQFIFRNNSYTIQAVGVAIPGRYLENDCITTNNPTWKNFDLADIRRKVSFPVYFSNNVNCMALASAFFLLTNWMRILSIFILHGVCTALICTMAKSTAKAILSSAKLVIPSFVLTEKSVVADVEDVCRLMLVKVG